MLGNGQHVGQMGGGQAVIKVAVLVHGADLDHGHVHRDVLTVEAGQLGIAHRAEVPHPLGRDLPVHAAHMPGVPGKMLAGVVCLADLRHPHRHAAADVYVGQLVLSGRQRPVQGHGVIGAPTIVHPVAGLDDLDGLGSGGPLFLIFGLIIHSIHSFFISSTYKRPV